MVWFLNKWYDINYDIKVVLYYLVGQPNLTGNKVSFGLWDRILLIATTQLSPELNNLDWGGSIIAR